MNFNYLPHVRIDVLMEIWYFSENLRSIEKLGLILLSFFLGHVHPVSFWKGIKAIRLILMHL